MKTILTFLTIISCSILFSQTATYPISKKGDYQTYISKDKIEFKIGQKIAIGLPFRNTEFLFLTQNNLNVTGRISGSQVTITQLKSDGKEKTGFKMYAYFKGFGIAPVIVDIEQALKTNEIEIIE